MLVLVARWNSQMQQHYCCSSLCLVVVGRGTRVSCDKPFPGAVRQNFNVLRALQVATNGVMGSSPRCNAGPTRCMNSWLQLLHPVCQYGCSRYRRSAGPVLTWRESFCRDSGARGQRDRCRSDAALFASKRGAMLMLARHVRQSRAVMVATPLPRQHFSPTAAALLSLSLSLPCVSFLHSMV